MMSGPQPGSDDARGIAGDQRPLRHVLRHHRTRADDTMIADRHARQNDRPCPDKAAGADPRIDMASVNEVMSEYLHPRRDDGIERFPFILVRSRRN